LENPRKPAPPHQPYQPIVFCDGKFYLTPLERTVSAAFGRFLKKMEKKHKVPKINNHP
jgi:hypothetical protein